jgi:hypothetical protein
MVPDVSSVVQRAEGQISCSRPPSGHVEAGHRTKRLSRTSRGKFAARDVKNGCHRFPAGNFYVGGEGRNVEPRADRQLSVTHADLVLLQR